MHFNQKNDKNHYQEHLETQEDNAFESEWNRVSIENSTVTKDRILDPVCIVKNTNQLPTKVTSKLKVVLFT